MTHSKLQAAGWTVLLTAWAAMPAMAQTGYATVNPSGSHRSSVAGRATYSASGTIQQVSAQTSSVVHAQNTQAPQAAPGRLPAHPHAAPAYGYPAAGYGAYGNAPVPLELGYGPRAGVAAVPAQNGYPYLNAPLYTSPRQNIPYQVGGTIVPNQAFAPHEMLYEHDYKALYPPYSYKVSGGWVVTPWGVYSKDHWKLQGTEVKVKYRSKIPFHAHFKKPLIR